MINAGHPKIRDKAGKLLDFGTLKHTLEWNPMESTTLALPAWLSSFGTPAHVVNDASTGRPGVTVKAPAGSGAARSLLFEKPVSLSRLSALYVEWLGVEQVTAPGGLEIQLRMTENNASTPTVGALVTIPSYQPNTANIRHGTVVTPTTYSPNDATYTGLNLGVLTVCSTGYTYLFEGENEVAFASGANLPTTSNIRPSLTFYTSNEGALHIGGVRMTAWFD